MKITLRYSNIVITGFRWPKNGGNGKTSIHFNAGAFEYTLESPDTDLPNTVSVLKSYFRRGVTYEELEIISKEVNTMCEKNGLFGYKKSEL